MSRSTGSSSALEHGSTFLLPVTYTATRRVSKAKKGKRVHVCQYPGCDKIFTRAEHKRRHELCHNPDAWYRCGYNGCKKTFRRQELFHRHLRIHSSLGQQTGRRQRKLQNSNPAPRAPPGLVDSEPVSSKCIPVEKHAKKPFLSSTNMASTESIVTPEARPIITNNGPSSVRNEIEMTPPHSSSPCTILHEESSGTSSSSTDSVFTNSPFCSPPPETICSSPSPDGTRSSFELLFPFSDSFVQPPPVVLDATTTTTTIDRCFLDHMLRLDTQFNFPPQQQQQQQQQSWDSCDDGSLHVSDIIPVSPVCSEGDASHLLLEQQDSPHVECQCQYQNHYPCPYSMWTGPCPAPLQ